MTAPDAPDAPPSHPMQPLVRDAEGTIRFKKNAVARFLLDTSQYDLNKLWTMDFPKEDWAQFYQLIGYSVGGFGEIFSERAPELVAQADTLAEDLP